MAKLKIRKMGEEMMSKVCRTVPEITHPTL